MLSLSRSLCALAFSTLAVPTLAATNFVSSDQQAANHPSVKAVEYFGQLVAQRTKGELTVTVSAGGVLGTENAALQAVAEGKQAMARVNLGLLSSVPAVQLASLPYLFRSNSHMQKVLAGDFGKRIDDDLAKAGYIRLIYLNSSPRNFLCRKPIRTKDDFANLKIRTMSSDVLAQLIKNLGAQPVAMPVNEISDALKNGVVECAEGSIVNFFNSEQYKFANYLIQDEHLLLPEVLLMSKKLWDTLTPEQQTTLRTAGDEASRFMDQQWTGQETTALATMKKAGVTVITRAQMSMAGIEAQAMKTYNSFIKDPNDMQLVMKVMTQ